MAAWGRAECGALDPVALHVRVVEVQHSVAVITISLLVAEVDDNEISLAAAHGPRQPVLTCDKTAPRFRDGPKPPRMATSTGPSSGPGRTCVDAEMRIRGWRKCQLRESPQE